jgi:catechol 2,3-dioxygenase-like lactoylglutathione lyase family enzyme
MSKALVVILALILSGVAQAQQTSAARPAIAGISHVTLFADDIPKSQAFYASLLGWETVPPTGAQSGVRFYANHVQYVELVSPSQPGLPDRLDVLGFCTSDADSLRKFLAAQGVSVPAAVSIKTDGSRSFLVHDPEGNKVQFTQEGDHPPDAPKSAAQRLSSHIIHAGYMVHNRAALDRFYKDVLGFHLYWQGGAQEGHIDWVRMQVPNGTDWLEYMLYLPANPPRAQLGGANHIAPGVVSVADLRKKLGERGWKSADNENPQVLGVDGKMQLDLTDPDGARVEFMEFLPVKKPCCAPYTGRQPSASSAWQCRPMPVERRNRTKTRS